jgi:hypothetical protein
MDVSALKKLRGLKRLELVGFDVDRHAVESSAPSSTEIMIQ